MVMSTAALSGSSVAGGADTTRPSGDVAAPTATEHEPTAAGNANSEVSSVPEVTWVLTGSTVVAPHCSLAAVVHLVDRLMERQLDGIGSYYLKEKMEALGVQVLLNKSTLKFLGATKVEGVAFVDGSRIDADLVVVAAGIRPNVDLGRKAGLRVNRGIVVNDHMETSNPRHLRGRRMRGAQRRLLRAGGAALRAGQGARRDDHRQQGADLQGHDAGGQAEDHGRRRLLGRRLEPTRTTRVGALSKIRALGVYKKLVLRDNRWPGVILVGDTGDSHRYMEWLRTDADLTGQRRHLLFPPPPADAGLESAQMADTATICGCIGVTKGAIIQAIHEKGVNTLSQLKEAHPREHGLRQLLRRSARSC